MYLRLKTAPILQVSYAKSISCAGPTRIKILVMGFLLLFFLTSSPPASTVVQCLESQSMAKTVVILLLAFALAG